MPSPRILEKAAAALLAVGCLMTLLMMVHVSLDVSGRLVFSAPLGGTLETVTYIYMVGCVFLPLTMVQRRRQQIIVEVFSQVLPPRALALLDGLVGIAGVGFMLAIAWFSGGEAWLQTLSREVAPSTQHPVPIWPARWLVPLGAAGVALTLAVQTAADLLFAVRGVPAAFDSARLEGALHPQLVPEI